MPLRIKIHNPFTTIRRNDILWTNSHTLLDRCRILILHEVIFYRPPKNLRKYFISKSKILEDSLLQHFFVTIAISVKLICIYNEDNPDFFKYSQVV